MSIMWKYLDKRSATIAAIKDYGSMKFIIDTTGDDIKQAYDRMSGASTPKWDGMPKSFNARASEDRLVNGIAEIDLLRERYRQAQEYMEWFGPAWKQLPDDDRYCLEAFYGDSKSYGSSAASYIAEYLNIETASAYRHKNRALDKLSTLLFGKL